MTPSASASSARPCPECSKPLPAATADQPHPICPACLLAQALASGTAFDPATSTTAAPPPPPPPTPGQIADKFPQFEILSCLGRGGMGVVYKARQKSLNRLVAIKILAPGRERDARFAERFAREAELLAKLSHPHIVTIHDFGETTGLFYIVMEFVDGVNLRDLIRDGKLEATQALAIVPPICDALQYAHEKGVVHRDIKPENLLLDREGRIKIADFGIAALVGSGDGAGERAGTPPYMAPEQDDAGPGPASAPAAVVDHRADIYALGVVLYEMLTGERPAKEVVAPSRKVQIDVRLDEIVLRALEKSPALRYQTAGEFRTQVETVVAAKDEAQGVPIAPRVSRMRVVGAGFGGALLGATIGGLGIYVSPWPAINRGLELGAVILAPLLVGWIAASRIRRSPGKLRRLWLATLALLTLVGVLVYYRYAEVGRATANLRAQAEATLQRNRAALDGEAPATMEPILDAWRQGNEVLAINRFVETDWNVRPVFASDSLLGLSEDQFAALPESERNSTGQELIAHIGELRELAASVEKAGTSAVAARDFDLARRHFDALKRCGRALDQPGATLLLRMVAQAIEKKAATELATLPMASVGNTSAASADIPATDAHPTVLAGTSTLVWPLPAGDDHWTGNMALANATAASSLSVNLGETVTAAATGEPPHVFAFQTPRGKRGLLQVTGFTENPHGGHLRYELLQAAQATGSSHPATGFLREPGSHLIDGAGSRIEIVPGADGRLTLPLTLSVIRITIGGRQTIRLPGFLKRDGWFAYVESPERIWLFDGDRQLDVLTPEGRYSAGAQGVGALCPQEVWAAVPAPTRTTLKTANNRPTPKPAVTAPAAPEEISFGGVKWQAWRTLFEVRDGDGLASLPRVRHGFDYGHWGHGRGPEIITHIGDPDWRDYRIEADLLVPGVDPALNPYNLNWHGAMIAFHVADRKESWNESGSSAYILGFEGEGNWSLTAHYNNYCHTHVGWGDNRSDGERKLASGTDAKLDPAKGNHFVIEVRGEHIQIWLDDRQLVDLVDEPMSEPIGGRTLDHGGVSFIGGFDAMIRLRNFSITHFAGGPRRP